MEGAAMSDSISAFGVDHGVVSKAAAYAGSGPLGRKDLVPPEGQPNKYAPRVEDVRAAARNVVNKPGTLGGKGPGLGAKLKLIRGAKNL
jgi:hypothetical protein